MIRPDGHPGLLADTADPEVLRRYLVDALQIREAPSVPGRGAAEREALPG